MLKRIGRSRAAQGALAFFAAHYLRLVERTTRFTVEPADFRDRALKEAPVIAALWHGQHLGAHFAWPSGMKVAALISRNRDAEANALALQRLGVIPIRGSGGRAEKMRKRGGFQALREMLRTLKDGVSLVLTADVPKTARVVGEGVVTLAKLSGRPIYPLAVASARRIDFNSWDRASVPLPFSRGAIVVGDPIRVPHDATPEQIEAARREVESALDAAHARAYAILGSTDPGAGLREAAAARKGARP
jgi:lysophospholipid acyltransferase (LPLAT)-like uncharacterized protein